MKQNEILEDKNLRTRGLVSEGARSSQIVLVGDLRLFCQTK